MDIFGIHIYIHSKILYNSRICFTDFRYLIRNFREIFFFKFFLLTALFMLQRVCLQTFGGSRPDGLGGDRERTDST
jgi:hypothetical protein